MTDVVAHRGPDSAGYYVKGSIGLGHRRLSIIDLATGDQPLGNEDGTVQVVFNGEIYNFGEVREMLLDRGHRFRTRSDTEVIVHAFEEWGDACVERFRGMFAFAVVGRQASGPAAGARSPWREAAVLRAASGGHRVRVGDQSLLEDADVDREWSPEALDAYLTLGYVPAPDTIYRHVHKLDAGFTLRLENGQSTLRQYWDLIFTGDGDPSREQEYLDRLDELLHEAVRLRLISDVPLGAFLSGGIDSSAVVSTMTRTSDGVVETMSVGFDAREFDELDHAQAVARHLGVESHTRIVQPDVEGLLPKLAWHFDEPFADSSAVPTYLRFGCGPGAGHGRPVRRRRRRAVGRLRATHRVESAEAQARRWLGPMAAAAGRLSGVLPAGLKGHAVPRSPPIRAGIGVCAEARLRLLREPGSGRALHPRLCGFREAFRSVREASPLV
jgi:asparagine synthase (glutamine-hydrolysing)